MTQPLKGTWLSLGDACKQMGVSESTIRRWADAGDIRSYRTAGGHRRVLEEDLLAMLANHAPAASRDTDRISDIALARVKRRITRGRQAHSLAHFEALSPEAIDRLRLLGRQVVDLFARYISSNAPKKERFNEDARTIGREYGRSLVAEHVGLTAAVATFNSMRRSLEETASQIANEAGLSAEEAVEAVESTLELADQMLEGMASVYESASASAATG